MEVKGTVESLKEFDTEPDEGMTSKQKKMESMGRI